MERSAEWRIHRIRLVGDAGKRCAFDRSPLQLLMRRGPLQASSAMGSALMVVGPGHSRTPPPLPPTSISTSKATIGTPALRRDLDAPRERRADLSFARGATCLSSTATPVSVTLTYGGRPICRRLVCLPHPPPPPSRRADQRAKTRSTGARYPHEAGAPHGEAHTRVARAREVHLSPTPEASRWEGFATPGWLVHTASAESLLLSQRDGRSAKRISGPELASTSPRGRSKVATDGGACATL